VGGFYQAFHYGSDMVEGDQITPTLRLIRPLGRVESSHVWQAHDSKLDQDVAVKVLGKALARHSPQLHRFQREAEVAAHIKSAHIAHVLSHGVTTSGLPFLTMELLEGEDLATHLQRKSPMSLPHVARLVSQLSRALGKAHLLGLVHRNLKPTNVLLVETSDGPFDVKVLDVGLSSGAEFAMNNRTSMAEVEQLLPLEFASPEQVFGVKEVDYRADLWAIAIIAYHALTGRMPFHGASPDAFAKAVDHGSFALPSTVHSSLPAAIDAWFVKALQRDPASRFGGAKELADEFMRAAGIDFHERLARASMFPSASVQQALTRAGNDASSPRLPLASLTAERTSKDTITVIGANQSGRSTSALLITFMAIIGIGTVIVGLTLLQR
jgi:serine/threonine-protein kinase